MTIDEFAALCREKCSNPAQWYDGENPPHCGESYDADGEPAFAFCGFHMAVVIGND